jgi:hypothetical protein
MKDKKCYIFLVFKRGEKIFSNQKESFFLKKRETEKEENRKKSPNGKNLKAKISHQMWIFVVG